MVSLWMAMVAPSLAVRSPWVAVVELCATMVSPWGAMVELWVAVVSLGDHSAPGDVSVGGYSRTVDLASVWVAVVELWVAVVSLWVAVPRWYQHWLCWHHG